MHFNNSTAARWWLAMGCWNAAIAVALGAAGTHALKNQLIANNAVQLFETAVHYHQFHALGLVLTGLVAHQNSRQRLHHFAGGLMLVGIVLFSGILYVRSLGGVQIFHALIPAGGAAWIVAWIFLGFAATRGCVKTCRGLQNTPPQNLG